VLATPSIVASQLQQAQQQVTQYTSSTSIGDAQVDGVMADVGAAFLASVTFKAKRSKAEELQAIFATECSRMGVYLQFETLECPGFSLLSEASGTYKLSVLRIPGVSGASSHRNYIKNLIDTVTPKLLNGGILYMAPVLTSEIEIVNGNEVYTNAAIRKFSTLYARIGTFDIVQLESMLEKLEPISTIDNQAWTWSYTAPESMVPMVSSCFFSLLVRKGYLPKTFSFTSTPSTVSINAISMPDPGLMKAISAANSQSLAAAGINPSQLHNGVTGSNYSVESESMLNALQRGQNATSKH